MIPIFLDCEASSLGPQSYPIQIAWCDPYGNIKSHMINVYLYPDHYRDWDPAAQKIHGLSRKHLMSIGKPPELVVEHMIEELSGKTIYTDAPDYDGFWVERLFQSVNSKCDFKIENIEILLRKLLPEEYWIFDSNSYSFPIAHVYKQARINCGLPAHKADHDVAYLIELYKESKRLGNESD